MRSFICNVELIQIWFDLGLVMDEITKPLEIIPVQWIDKVLEIALLKK